MMATAKGKGQPEREREKQREDRHQLTVLFCSVDVLDILHGTVLYHMYNHMYTNRRKEIEV